MTYLGKSNARASSEFSSNSGLYGPEKAIDGLISENNVNFFHSNKEDNPWLELSIPEDYFIGLKIVTRFDCCAERLRDLEIRAGNSPVPSGSIGRLTVNTKVATFDGPAVEGQTYRINFDRRILAKYVTIQKIGRGVYLEINEVTVLTGDVKKMLSTCK